MATAVGGSILSVALAGREFAVPADNETNQKLGGFTNEVESNGNATGRLIKTRTSWMLDGLAVEINNNNGDQEFLQDLADSNAMFTAVISYVSGKDYTGTGQLTGDLAYASKSATMPISLTGVGKLT